MTATANHPAKQQLVAFGLGTLGPDEATAVEQHLEACPDCCETMLDLADDTFVGLVRQCEVSADGTDLTGATLAPGASAAADGLPPALAAHDRYEILELVGRGGMGDVYRAQHMLMNRQVALKVIKPQLVKSEAAVERFRREVQAAARLHHRHIVTAYDADKAGDLHFLVMEFVEGVNLDEVIRRRGPLPAAEACDYIRQAAEGLQHAYELGMVHRDIKPHNLMVSAAGQVKILDFGLAGFATEVAEEGVRPETSRPEVETAAALHQLTQMGTMMGTPDYIAPEQAANAHAADIRADIYSLGCTLFTLLTGRAPFGEGSVLDKIKAHSQQEPPAISQFRDDVPAELESVLVKMMAKDPAARYQTPAEVVAALEQCTATASPLTAVKPGRARRRPWTLIALASVLTSIAAGVIFYIATDTGRLEIDSGVDIPGARIVLLKDGKEYATFDVEPGPKRQTIRAGEYEIVLRGAPDGTDVKVWSTKKGQPRDYGSPLDPKDKVFAVYRGGGMIIEVAKQPAAPVASSAKDPSAPSAFFEVLGDLQAIIRKTLTDEGLSVGQMQPGAQVRGPRRQIIFQAEVTGEREEGNKALTALRDRFKALSRESDALFSGLDQQMHGAVAATNLSYTTPAREGLIRVTMRELSLMRTPKSSTWRLVVQVEEWPLAKSDGQMAAATPSQLTRSSLYFERLAGEPLESAVRERVGGDVGRKIVSERIPQPPGRLRYEATIDGVGGKIIDNVFVDLQDLLMRGTDAQVVHHGEQGVALRLLRYTTPTYNGEVRVTLNSREVGGQPADESTKWLLKIEASEWAKGESQGTPAVVRVEHSGGGTTLYLDGAPLLRDELVARLDALATGDPGLQVHVEGDVVPVSKEVLELMEAIAATSVGKDNVKFPSEVTRRIMDDAVQRGKAMRAATQLVEAGRFKGHEGAVYRAIVSPNGRNGISCGSDKTVRIWDLETRDQKHVLKGHADAVYGLAVSADGKTLASSDRVRSIRLWNLETGEALGELTGHEEAVTDLAFLPDGRLLSAGFDETLRLWNVEERKLVRTIELGAKVEKMAPLWDGKRVMLSGAHTAGWGMLTYDLERGERISPPPSAQSCLAVSADQRKVLIGSITGLMRVTDMASGELVVQLADPRAKAARDAAISPDGRFALTTTRESSMHLWDLREGKLLSTVTGDTIGTINLSPDGRFALTVGRGGEVGVWRLPESAAQVEPTLN